jgi:hypothetical protein
MKMPSSFLLRLRFKGGDPKCEGPESPLVQRDRDWKPGTSPAGVSAACCRGNGTDGRFEHLSSRRRDAWWWYSNFQQDAEKRILLKAKGQRPKGKLADPRRARNFTQYDIGVTHAIGLFEPVQRVIGFSTRAVDHRIDSWRCLRTGGMDLWLSTPAPVNCLRPQHGR